MFYLIMLVLPVLESVQLTTATFVLKDRSTMLFYTNGHAADLKESVALCAKVGGTLPFIHSDADADLI